MLDFIVELAEILWPVEDPGRDWNSDVLDEIDDLFTRYGWHPLTPQPS
jgi:hypothetical protein